MVMGTYSGHVVPGLAGAAVAAAALYAVGCRRARVSAAGPLEAACDGDADAADLDLRLFRKAECAVLGRTSRLTVVVERCTNDHNYSAILRSVEALGVQNVWLVAPPEQATVAGDALLRSTGQRVGKAVSAEVSARALHHLFARNATEWLTLREFDSTAACVAALRATGHAIWATDLGQGAVSLTREGLPAGPDGAVVPEKVALVVGTESVGVTAEMLAAADLRVYLPLRGFADSLNLSVATALCVHQLFTLDPSLAGAMDAADRATLRQAWYEKLARQRVMTRRDKKTRKFLAGAVAEAEDIERAAAAGRPPHHNQLKKLGDLPARRAALAAFDADVDAKAAAAAAPLVRAPPAPLGDMRRADEHRVTRAGRKTKEKAKDFWKDLPHTTCYSGAARAGRKQVEK